MGKMACAVIVNIAGRNIEDYAKLAAILDGVAA